MRTPGGWRVEAITVDGVGRFRVTYCGYLYGGTPGRGRGLCATVEQVQRLLGEEFAHLVDEEPAA